MIDFCRFLAKGFLVIELAFSLAGCATAPASKDYTSFRSHDPHSILVVPVINHSNEVQAGDLFLTTLAVPLAERGYYVFPTNMVKDIMQNEGLADAYLVHKTPTQDLASLFDAQAVLYVEVIDWKSQYVVTASNITVEFLYTLKDGKSGDMLWQKQQSFTYSNSANSGNIIANIIANAIISAINNGKADYTPVAINANALALLTPGQGLPYGPHSTNYKKDNKEFPSSGSGDISNATQVAVSTPGFKPAPSKPPVK
jgi:hypothetical protein